MATFATRVIPATPTAVMSAFTRGIVLRQWLCDVATVSPRPGGGLYLWWHEGAWVAGSFGAIEPASSLVMRWEAARDRPAGQVAVSLEADGGATRIRLEHEPGPGDDAGAIDRFWDEALANLAYLFETGLDRRVYERPMVGIFLNVFDEAVAARLRVPVAQGSRVDGVMPGSGAERAGLVHDDVLVEVAGHPLTDPGAVAEALTGRGPGDVVEIAFYRDGERKTAALELMRRPRPAIPFSAAMLAEDIRRGYRDALDELASLFEGVGQEAVTWREAPDSWTALEVLAHLIHAERSWVTNLADVVAYRERTGDDEGGNLDAQVAATAGAFGSADALLGELRHLADEAVALAASLPPEFVEARCPYVSAARPLVETREHIRGHAGQIRATLEAAKAAPLVAAAGDRG